ncbi:MerR family transcriptional regulator [Nocardia donostiensis]|uniref:MerR family transcriptional regulator n=1 Tax=Nocardia donostiensis TaxID=1538463 RepID=A0A1W0BK18_9NOCA|nr:MerR family transcriptional regulator [Nocardia donostiensis]ONM48878.1 MerR family transcriptional regulator [Nocardia donostiensis]OQS22867.1 MerR family transcriptional regulator [Nocardia donostiensis]
MSTDTEGGYLQIGQVAEQTELSIKTIRHYDDVGLVMPSARSGGGFRLYTTADVERLLVIRRMKPLGFTLAEMKQLLDAFDVLAGDTATAAQRSAATEFLRECRGKTRDSIDRLRRHLAYAEEFSAVLDIG